MDDRFRRDQTASNDCQVESQLIHLSQPVKHIPARPPGRNRHRRQNLAPVTTPRTVNIGMTPARTRDDLPPPVAPSASRKTGAVVGIARQGVDDLPFCLLTAEEDPACYASRPRKSEPCVQV